MIVVARRSGLDIEMIEEFSRGSCVLARDEVDGLEDLQRAQGDVFEVADWSRDEVKHRGGLRG